MFIVRPDVSYSLSHRKLYCYVKCRSSIFMYRIYVVFLYENMTQTYSIQIGIFYFVVKHHLIESWRTSMLYSIRESHHIYLYVKLCTCLPLTSTLSTLFYFLSNVLSVPCDKMPSRFFQNVIVQLFVNDDGLAFQTNGTPIFVRRLKVLWTVREFFYPILASTCIKKL